jgi:hypothetical protein
MDLTEPRLPLLWMHVYSCVAWQQISYISVLLLGADCIENSFPSVVASVCVYRAVSWQCVDQICYIAPSLRLFILKSLMVHRLSFLSGGYAFSVFLQVVLSLR